jgi:hypothetical protein
MPLLMRLGICPEEECDLDGRNVVMRRVKIDVMLIAGRMVLR